MASSHLFHVDAFTDVPFTGNPAAVCVLRASAPESWMQGLARDMNLSETAFVHPANDAGSFALRWFTPQVEVNLCGHATLATAHVLWESGALSPDRAASFHTQSGLLTAVRTDGWIDLDFPATPVEAEDEDWRYLDAVGVKKPVFFGKAGPRHIVQVATESELRGLRPDFWALRALPGRGLAVTTKADRPPFDFVSRYFAPWVGVDEDPVTGSVHCALAVFWAERLGRREMRAYQASARGGELRLRLRGERVHLGGRAITVSSGDILVPLRCS